MEAFRLCSSTARSLALALSVCIAVLALPAAAWGQGEDRGEAPELVTDRPDQTESAETVSPGRVQVELGLLRSEDDAGGVDSESDELGGTLVRVGLVEDWELRLGWGGLVDAAGADGAADAEVGVKWRLGRSASGRTTTALLASTSVPVGDDELTSDVYEPSVRLAFAHTLTDRLGLSYNLGAERFHEAEESFTRFFYTVALGAGLTDRLGAFVEVFGEEPESGAPGGSQVSLDGGVTYLLRPNLQLDAYAGAGVTDHAPDWLAGVGLSVRWPR